MNLKIENNGNLFCYKPFYRILSVYYMKYVSLILNEIRTEAKGCFSDLGVKQPFEQEESDDYEFIILKNDYKENKFILGVAWLEYCKNPRKDDYIKLDLVRMNEFVWYEILNDKSFKFKAEKIRIRKDSILSMFKDVERTGRTMHLYGIFKMLLDEDGIIDEKIKSYEWDKNKRYTLANFPISWGSFNIKLNYERSKNHQPNINHEINSEKLSNPFRELKNNRSETVSLLNLVFMENFCKNFIKII